MDLTVLSALARLGLDPWAEAGRLTALPKETAAAAIDCLLALKGDLRTATRLAALLPMRNSLGPVNQGPSGKVQATVKNRAGILLAIWLAGGILYLLSTSHTRMAINAPSPAIGATGATGAAVAPGTPTPKAQ